MPFYSGAAVASITAGAVQLDFFGRSVLPPCALHPKNDQTFLVGLMSELVPFTVFEDEQFATTLVFRCIPSRQTAYELRYIYISSSSLKTRDSFD